MKMKNLEKLSFYVDTKCIQAPKKNLSMTICKLKGIWKLNRTADTNFYILPHEFFLNNSLSNIARSQCILDEHYGKIKTCVDAISAN